MPLTVLSVAYPLARVSPGTAGGAEQVLLTIDKELVRRGHRSLVVAAAGSRCSGLLIPVRIPAGELDDNAKLKARCSFNDAILRVLASHQVDVVHMHGLDFHEYLPGTHVSIVVTLHLPMAWYCSTALRSRCSNVKLVTVSHTQAASAPADIRVDATIPNGIELGDFPARDKRGNYALVLGRICAEKGIHLALDAAERAGVPVILAGKVFDYPEHRDYYKRAIRPRLGRRIRFIGPVGGQCKAELLAGARCLLVASQAPETSSLVAMESMASGTPVIAWRNGALSEIVAHGRTGWLVSSVQEMADAIAHVDELDATECRREAERRFSSDKMTSGYVGLYRSLIAESMAREFQAA
jgi:glycosyltransferase involved in cell wall biosynthesis